MRLVLLIAILMVSISCENWTKEPNTNSYDYVKAEYRSSKEDFFSKVKEIVPCEKVAVSALQKTINELETESVLQVEIINPKDNINETVGLSIKNALLSNLYKQEIKNLDDFSAVKTIYNDLEQIATHHTRETKIVFNSVENE